MITEIPDNWELPLLEDICSVIINGYVGPTRDIYRTSGIPYIVSKNVKPNLMIEEPFAFVDEDFQKKNRRSILHSGDVLTVQTGSIGDTAVVPKSLEGANCHALIISRPITDRLNSYWLSEYFNSYLGHKQLDRIATGSAHPHLNTTFVRKIRIPLPPIQEQNKILEVLNSINEINQSKLQTNLIHLKRGLLHRLLTRGIGHTMFKQTKIGEIPESWKLKQIGQLVRLSSGKKKPTDIVSEEDLSHPIPVYGGNGIIGYSARILSEHPTIVIGRVGENCGNVHMSSDQCWITDNALFVVKNLSKYCDLVYLSLVLENMNINRLKKQSGQPLITQSIVNPLCVPIPPIQEQKEIVKYLTEISKLIELEKTCLRGISLLKKGLMQVLLTGKVRVKT